MDETKQKQRSVNLSDEQMRRLRELAGTLLIYPHDTVSDIIRYVADHGKVEGGEEKVLLVKRS